jgi:hypothetical protein
MNLLTELAALRDPHRFDVDSYRQALADAWAGLERILSDPRFLSLREMLGARTDDEVRRLRDELIRLRSQRFEVPENPTEPRLEGVIAALVYARFPATAAMLRRDHPLLFELAGALLGDPRLQSLVHELRRIEKEEEEEALEDEAEEGDDGLDLDEEDYDEDEDEDEEYELSLDRPPVPAPGSPVPMPASTPEPTAVLAPQRRRAEDHEDEEVGEEETARATSLRKKKSSIGTSKPEAATFRRRASVRWYHRMNPQRMFPLNVVLAQGRLREVLRPGQAQAAAKEQLVVTKDDPFIRIRPVLPGCTVYPDEQVVDATPEKVEVRFQVVPQMLGKVEDARIEFYQHHRLLTKIELPMVVSKQTLAVVFASLGLAWPVLGTVVKSVAGDAAGEPKDFLMRGLTWALAQPHALEIGLGLGAIAAALWWWWNRPSESSAVTGLDDLQPMTVPELLQAAHTALARGDRAEARSCVEDALNLDPKNSIAADLLRRCRE